MERAGEVAEGGVSEWLPVATMQQDTWCRTKREGENGECESFWRICPGDNPEFDREYIDRDGYTTLVNPGSFAPPTHWKPLE